MSLTPEEAELFGSFETQSAKPAPTETPDDDWGLDPEPAPVETAPAVDAAPAIIPPDAPPNDAKEPAPEKKTRKPRAAKTEPTERVPTGWKDFICPDCGHNFGARPPDHKIDPIVCPNFAKHAGSPGATPSTITVELGPNTIQVLRDLISAITNLPSPSQD